MHTSLFAALLCVLITARLASARPSKHFSPMVVLSTDPRATTPGASSPPSRAAGHSATLSSFPVQPLPSSETLALIMAYSALGGPNWTVNFGWTNVSDPCGTPGWFGVTCKVLGNASHVTALELPRNNLQGVLPPLADLEYLVDIDLSNLQGADTPTSNAVSGTLDALCGLGRLKTVTLAYNSIAGRLPPCVRAMVAATSLDLSYNSIGGPTPVEMCDLVELEVLNLRGNRLNGTVPECLGDLSALRTIDYTNLGVDGNPGPQSLEGTLPASLCQLTGLENLMFQGTQGLSGHIPDCLGRGQPQLTLVVIQRNQFTGAVPESLCEASKLNFLYLYRNRLTGTIPSCIGNLAHLTDLELGANDLRGPIPEELCRLVNMQKLYLYNNRLAGTIPSCFGNFLHLTNLELGANDLRGPIPEELCRLVNMQKLYLYKNHLTGTIPSCFGNFTHLTELDLDTNYLRESLPASLCRLFDLEYLYLYDNHLDGTLPTCFGTSFPKLQAMPLNDNYLHGYLPMIWNLPSLISIVLSNNAGLHGPLPPSLFSQQFVSTTLSSTPNHALRAVVIEGTGISGAIPLEVCDAPQLQTLALSGNRLTGSLPVCLFALKYLGTFQAAHNQLDGTLSGAIGDLTALAAFDLGNNALTGLVPSELGDLSPQLDVMSLEQNYLSCDLPATVRHWQAPANKKAATTTNKYHFKLLNGNLFGCGGGALALSMQDAPGIHHANPTDADAYSCGGAAYVLPVSAIGAVALPVAAALPLMWWFGDLRLGWRAGLSWRVEDSFCVGELHEASRALSRLGLSVFGAAAASAAMVLGLVQLPGVATSLYECEYAAEATLANKGGVGGDMMVLSCGVGVALGLCLMMSLAMWWRPWLIPDLEERKDDVTGEARQPYMFNYHDGTSFTSEREAEAQRDEASSAAPWLSIIKAWCLLLGTVALSVGPNVSYVLIVLSKLSYTLKLGSEASVTVFKSIVSALVIPLAARWAAHLLVPAEALLFVRFQVRLTLSTAVAALSTIAAPVIIVLVTDDRCLYKAWHSPNEVTTDVAVKYCVTFSTITTGRQSCLVYDEDLVQSTYTPAFDYDGSRCVSAVLSTYAPVFLAAVLLTAAVPAAMELLVVPALAPWCHRNSASSSFADGILQGLRMMTWNVLPTLQAADQRMSSVTSIAAQGDNGALPDLALSAEHPPVVPIPPVDVDYLAQRVVERGILQLIGTLLIALTFGLAAPPVGGACALAALVQLAHHQHVLGVIVACGIAGSQGSPGGGRVPDLKGCGFAPASCANVVVLTVLSFWGCASVQFLDPLPLASAAAAAALACALLWVGVTRALRVLNDAKVAKARASVRSSADMSLVEEPLVGGEGLE